MQIITLDQIIAEFKQYPTPKLFFGTDPEKKFRLYRANAHPDRNIGDDRAKDIYNRLDVWYNRLSSPIPPLVSPKRRYEMDGIVYVGDVADIHQGTFEDKQYLLKISRVDGGERLLDREQKSLTHLLTKAGTKTYSKYLPTLAESFLAKDKIQKRVNVFVKNVDTFYTLEEVHSKHPILDGRHLAWIFKRMLTILGFAHRQQIVHAAVLPSHVLLNVEGHGLQLVGWGQSVEFNEQVKSISTAYRSWYPHEIFAKKPVDGTTDLYLAAKCIIYLGGGDLATNLLPSNVPPELSRFFRSCLLEGQKMRPVDAWKLLEDFDSLLKQLYGPPKFHPLSMETK